MRLDYIAATVEEMALHFKDATGQLIYITKDRYKDNPEMLHKINLAHNRAKELRNQDAIKQKMEKIKLKIARLQDELLSLAVQLDRGD